jgi:hypothetical protein
VLELAQRGVMDGQIAVDVDSLATLTGQSS